jgi:hypothetical protein
VLALALLPLEFAFWVGFALPLGPVAGAARTVLLQAGADAWARRSAVHVRPARKITNRRSGPRRRPVERPPMAPVREES